MDRKNIYFYLFGPSKITLHIQQAIIEIEIGAKFLQIIFQTVISERDSFHFFVVYELRKFEDSRIQWNKENSIPTALRSNSVVVFSSNWMQKMLRRLVYQWNSYVPRMHDSVYSDLLY